LRARDKHTFGPGGLIATTAFRRRHTNQFGLCRSARLGQLVANHILDILNADEDVFRLEVSVDDAAAPMHVVQTEEDLLADLAHEPNWDALGLVSLDETEEILAQDLEDHANVDTIWTFVLEVVEEGDDM